MTSSIDDFPEHLIPPEQGKSPRKTGFQFGDDDEDDLPLNPAEETPEEPVLPDEEEREVDDSPTPPEGSTVLAEETFAPRIDSASLAVAADSVLQDPALKTITQINEQRFLKKPKRIEEQARVTRAWLNSLEQRDFFLAIAYPGVHLHRLLDGHASLGQIRAWCNGLEGVPELLRRVLTLEHLLDRRTLSNRDKMPSRHQIEQALSVMPRTADVSKVLGGFEGLSFRDEQQHPQSKQIHTTGVEQVSEMLRIVEPGSPPRKAGPKRPGSALPISKRLLGKGRPLGQRLLKPDAYCYSISTKSRDTLGQPRITPQQVMDLINGMADLERQYNCIYSMRRKDMSLPWCIGNVEFLPTEELERERDRARRGEEA